MNRITKFFNGIVEAHKKKQQIKEDFKIAKLAIKSGLVSNFTNAPLRADFSESERNMLLRMSIDTDDLEIFNLVLEHVAKGDPNYKLIDTLNCWPDGGSFHEESPLLYEAIAYKKPSVALSLAQNPKTDIKDFGYTRRTSASENTWKQHKSYLFLARENKMSKVSSILAERKADLLQAQAAELRQESKLAMG